MTAAPSLTPHLSLHCHILNTERRTPPVPVAASPKWEAGGILGAELQTGQVVCLHFIHTIIIWSDPYCDSWVLIITSSTDVCALPKKTPTTQPKHKNVFISVKKKKTKWKIIVEKTCSYFSSWNIDISEEILTNPPLMNVPANFQACHQSMKWKRTGKKIVFWTRKTFSSSASGSSKMLLTGRVLNWNKQENNDFVQNRDCQRLSGYCRNFPITTIPTKNFPLLSG